MRKSELYALYHHYGKQHLTEIDREEFFSVHQSVLRSDNSSISHYQVDGPTACTTVLTDGIEYMCFCSYWYVDEEIYTDSYFCKHTRIS